MKYKAYINDGFLFLFCFYLNIHWRVSCTSVYSFFFFLFADTKIIELYSSTVHRIKPNRTVENWCESS